MLIDARLFVETEKVLQRLGKQGFVSSLRGPKGGFRLACDADDVSLLDVYEAIEGPLQFSNCLFEQPVCGDGKCIMGDLLKSVDRQVAEYLRTTKLSAMEIAISGSSGRG